MKKWPSQRNVILGEGGSQNQNDGTRSAKGANMNAYTVQTLEGMVW